MIYPKEIKMSFKSTGEVIDLAGSSSSEDETNDNNNNVSIQDNRRSSSPRLARKRRRNEGGSGSDDDWNYTTGSNSAVATRSRGSDASTNNNNNANSNSTNNYLSSLLGDDDDDEINMNEAIARGLMRPRRTIRNGRPQNNHHDGNREVIDLLSSPDGPSDTAAAAAAASSSSVARGRTARGNSFYPSTSLAAHAAFTAGYSDSEDSDDEDGYLYSMARQWGGYYRHRMNTAAAANAAAAAAAFSSMTTDMDEIDQTNYHQLLEMLGDGSENRNLGASASTISSLPVNQLTNPQTELPEDKRTCNICLEDFEGGESRKCLPCLHGFHENCIDQWLRQNGVCPVCKTPVSD